MLALPASTNQGTLAIEQQQSQNNMGQARGYNELMDEYSLHQLMFRKGKLIDQTPEFVSFRRTYIDKWGPVSFIIMNFEKLFTDYNVSLAYVDGR
jgi:IQ domain-containing protein H